MDHFRPALRDCLKTVRRSIPIAKLEYRYTKSDLKTLYLMAGGKKPVFCSLTIWGCTGFDGLSTIAGCMPRLTDESRKSIIMD